MHKLQVLLLGAFSIFFLVNITELDRMFQTPIGPFLNGTLPVKYDHTPFSFVPAFDSLTLDDAITLRRVPNTNKMLVASRRGKLSVIDLNDSIPSADLLLDISEQTYPSELPQLA